MSHIIIGKAKSEPDFLSPEVLEEYPKSKLKTFNTLWQDAKLCLCPANGYRIEIKDEPPENCRYLLEQVLKNAQ